jgi:hypothetical protein
MNTDRVSECCGYPIITDTDFCSKCGEHCGEEPQAIYIAKVNLELLTETQLHELVGELKNNTCASLYEALLEHYKII